MSEFSGSYMRMTSDHSFPSSRPHNQNLSKLVVPTDELEGSVAERGLNIRPQNQNAKYLNVRTLYDREPNTAVVGGTMFLTGVGTPSGGKLKYPAGWNAQHPRLSRDPTWYPGRGKQRAQDIFHDVSGLVQGVGQVAAAVG